MPNRTQTNLLWALHEHGGDVHPEELTYDVGCTVQTVRRNLDRLDEAGLVSVFPYANGDFYALSDNGHAWIAENS